MPADEEREVKISDYYYKKSDIDTQMNNKVSKDGNKVLSDNNYTNAEKTKLANITPDNYVTTQLLSSTLSSYVVTSTLNNYYTQTEINNIIDTLRSSIETIPVEKITGILPANQVEHQDISDKVDKIEGKGLSTNDYTTSEKEKLNGIEVGANKTIVDNELDTTSTNPVQNNVLTEELNSKLEGSDVVDNLTTSNRYLPLSAKQGKYLYDTQNNWIPHVAGGTDLLVPYGYLPTIVISECDSNGLMTGDVFQQTTVNPYDAKTISKLYMFKAINLYDFLDTKGSIIQPKKIKFNDMEIPIKKVSFDGSYVDITNDDFPLNHVGLFTHNKPNYYTDDLYNNYDRFFILLNPCKKDVPTKISDLTNDSDFLSQTIYEMDFERVEKLRNKSSNITTDTGSTTKYPTVKAVEDYVDSIIGDLEEDMLS